jgi:hypothetical protein
MMWPLLGGVIYGWWATRDRKPRVKHPPVKWSGRAVGALWLGVAALWSLLTVLFCLVH